MSNSSKKRRDDEGRRRDYGDRSRRKYDEDRVDRRDRYDDDKRRSRERKDERRSDCRRKRSRSRDKRDKREGERRRRRRSNDRRSRSRERREERKRSDQRKNNHKRDDTRRNSQKSKEVEKEEPRWGRKEEYEEEEKTSVEEREKANFGLTGTLMADEETGAVVNGVVLKWSEPPEARKPSKKWRLYVFKGEELLNKLHIHRQSSFLVGREKRVADIPAYHPSISSQHAVIQFRSIGIPSRLGQTRHVVKPYLMDLESTNGTMLNKTKISPARYVELREKDLINFGHSTRDYVLIKE